MDIDFQPAIDFVPSDAKPIDFQPSAISSPNKTASKRPHLTREQIQDQVNSRSGFGNSPFMGKLMGGLGAIGDYVVTPLAHPVDTLLRAPDTIQNQIAYSIPSTGIQQVPLRPYEQPALPIQPVTTSDVAQSLGQTGLPNAVQGPLVDILTALRNAGGETISGLTTPQNLATLPFAGAEALGQKALLGKAFVGSMGAQAPGQVLDTVQQLRDPNMPPEQKLQGLAQLGINLGMTGVGMKAVSDAPTPRVELPFSTAEVSKADNLHFAADTIEQGVAQNKTATEEWKQQQLDKAATLRRQAESFREEEQRVKPAQQGVALLSRQPERPGLIGEQQGPRLPLTNPDLVQPPIDETRGKVSFGSEAEAGSIPSARQAATGKQVTPETQPDYPLKLSGVPSKQPETRTPSVSEQSATGPFEKGEPRKLGTPTFDRYIGNVYNEAVNGTELSRDNHEAEHSDLGLTAGDRWRYDTDSKVVTWTSKVSDESKHAVDSWLNKRGLQVLDHDEWFSKDEPGQAARLQQLKQLTNPTQDEVLERDALQTKSDTANKTMAAQFATQLKGGDKSGEVQKEEKGQSGLLDQKREPKQKAPFEDFLGKANQLGDVQGSKIDSRGHSHEDYGYRGQDRWEYNSELKTVSWHQEPTTEQKNAVESWLLKKGQEVKFHYDWTTGKQFDKNEPGSFSFAEAKQSAPEHIQAEHDQLGLRDGMSAHDLVSNIASKPEVFGQDQSALAKFLSDNFEHVLATAKVSPEASEVGRANYEGVAHQINLAADRDTGHSLVQRSLHEATHAATMWQIEYPRTDTQIKASQHIQDLMDFVKSKIPKDMTLDRNEPGDMGEFAYAMQDKGEFMAGIFSNPAIRKVLSELPYEGKSVFTRIVDSIKDLLGIKSGSVVDHVFDSMMEVGTERENIHSNIEDTFNKLRRDEPARRVMDEAVGWREKLSRTVAKWAGESAPRTVAASDEVGNKLIHYASAKIAAPAEARALASDVLGDRRNDPVFRAKLDAVLIEDRLRAIKGATSTVVGMEGSPFKTVKQLSDAKNDPAIRQAIEIHKATVQKQAESQHLGVGGKLAALGRETGAFVNLKAMFGDDEQAARQFAGIGGGRSGLTNPLQRSSAFSKKAKGTAERYQFDYAKTAERMITANYEEYTKQQLYDAYVAKGLAIADRPGIPSPTIGGQKTVKIPIERRRSEAPQNLWVRQDLAGELQAALQTDSQWEKGALGHVADIATDVQVAGPTDVTFHTVNMIASIMGSQGGKSAVGDILRRALGVREIDTIGRVASNLVKVIMDKPETQHVVADLAKIGALRGTAKSSGLITKGLEKLGVEGGTARWFDPNFYSGKMIEFVDKAGRLALNDMYSNLVDRKLVEDSDTGRREFINRMGQYNDRLMTKFQAAARNLGVSPFVVAGRNFNRLAFQRLLVNPGLRAANPQAWAKLRLIEGVGLMTTLFTVPVVANLTLTGKPFGRDSSIPVGAIDLGTDDPNGKHRYFDPLQMILLRRGLRISGVQSAVKGIESGQPWTHAAMNDIFTGVVHPWAGPVISAGKIIGTGRDVSGYLVSRNPENYGDNVIAALKNVNPTVASFFAGKEKGLLQPIGVKTAGSESFYERSNQEAQKQYGLDYEKLTVSQRASVQKQLDKTKPVQDELAKRSAAVKALWRDFEREDELQAALPDDVQKWLADKKLSLAGYESELTQSKEKIPLTQDESKRYQELLATNYEKMIRPLMAQPETSQKKLNLRLDQARLRARAALRRELGNPKEQTNKQ